jgi:S1-C subfamily serine protease
MGHVRVSRRTIALAAAAVVVVTGCTSSGSDSSATTTEPSTTVATTTTTTTIPATTTTVAALSASDVIDLIGPSVVFLSNEYGTGTGLAVADGYILTNAHVIAPFDAVDVTPPGGDPIEDVPVVGVDFAADLALVGPLDEPLPALEIATADGVGTGDGVFLIGYPSETDASPTPTIAEGIVSRIRDIEGFDQTYLQTDADIAGGQSGGALVDTLGRVVGISGLSLDEAFALALSADDVAERIDGMLTGGDDWMPLPDTGTTSGTVTIPGQAAPAVFEIPAADVDSELTFSFTGPDPDITFEVFVDDGNYVANQTAFDLSAALYDLEPADLLAELPPGSLIERNEDGSYTIELPADTRAAMRVGRTVEEPAEFQWTSSLPIVPIPDLDDDATSAPGDVVDGIIEPLEWQDLFTIELAAGQTVSITAASPTGDMAFLVYPVGAPPSIDTFYADDSDVGLGGLDASEEFTADTAGTYRIAVVCNDSQAGYRLTVDDA